MMALTLSVPCADWLTPCEYSVTTRGVWPNIWKNSATSGSDRPVASAVAATLPAMRRARASASSKPAGVAFDVVMIERAGVGEMHQQAAEQRGVGAGLQAQKQIGIPCGIGPARIDHHDARAALLLVGEHALEQYRMAPRRVGADQHQQIGLVEILVTARHGVGAERAAMAGDRGGHAQPRIGIDIGAADESLHQFVGDVVILGQHLAGQIERDRARAVARDDVRKAMRHMVERVAPGHPLHDALAAADHRIEQPASRAPGFRRAPSLSSTAGRNWRDVRDRPRSPRRRCRPASPARRSRRRNRDRSCAWRAARDRSTVMATA